MRARRFGYSRLSASILCVGATVGLAVALAPQAAADFSSDLKSRIDAARSSAGCPPLRSDPLLNDLSQRAVGQVDAWVNHTARVLPFSDAAVEGVPSLMQTLRDAGQSPAKAKMLNGYGDLDSGGAGDDQEKAIRATVLQGKGFEVFSDCAYTKYGLGAVTDDSSQGWPSTIPRPFSATVVIITGD